MSHTRRRDPLQPGFAFADTHDTTAPGALVTYDGHHHTTEQASIFDTEGV